MQLSIEYKLIQRAFGDRSSWPTMLKNEISYSSSSYTKHQIDVTKFTDDQLGMLVEAANIFVNDGVPYYKTFIRKVDQIINLRSSAGSDTFVRDLKSLPSHIQAYMRSAPHKILFFQEGDLFLPYVVDNCVYEKASGRGDYRTPAHVNLSVSYQLRGKRYRGSVTFYQNHVGRSVSNILAQKNFYIETEEQIEEYKEYLREYINIKDCIGLQSLAVGTASQASRNNWGWLFNKSIEMVRDGAPTKVIIDENSDEFEADHNSSSSSRSDSPVIYTEFWGESPQRIILEDPPSNESNVDDLEVDDEPESLDHFVVAPIHPYVKVFDMETHNWLSIYSQNLIPYPWDKNLMDKLILPKSQTDLISMLLETTKVKHEDIVKGKMQGVIVLATGVPGIGKTLTAEIFSEYIERPLYSVQCSQLGLSIDDIEKNLSKALHRASRWNAILLIDEADVYIRERGEDIHQNAIVGVFLRLIEYFSGILFMTSNRGEIIDDAIISRATAWIKYEKPSNELLAEIWSVLGQNYGVEFTDEEKTELVSILPGISGRTVRNLLKLSSLLSIKDDQRITPKLISQVSTYQKID